MYTYSYIYIHIHGNLVLNRGKLPVINPGLKTAIFLWVDRVKRLIKCKETPLKKNSNGVTDTDRKQPYGGFLRVSVTV